MTALFVLVPFLCLIALNLPLKAFSGKMAMCVGAALCVAQVLAVLLMPMWVFLDTRIQWPLFTLIHEADTLSQVMLVSIGIVVFIALLVANHTVKDSKRLLNFVSILLISMIGMNGVSLLTDLFSLYIFLEIAAVSFFILIAFDREKDALEGAFKYIILSAVASVLMLAGVALVLLLSGNTDFSSASSVLKDSAGHTYARIAIGAFVCGLLIKGGLVPFHTWVPGAYSTAPPAAAVLLAGIGTKVSGIYALIRLSASVFGPDPALLQVFLFVGAVSAVVGALAALGQRDFKWLLAYSSISQVGYILLGLGCGTPLGLMGAIFHFFNHAILKSLLFVNSAALKDRVGTTDMDLMGGLGTKMPATSITAALGALSTAGVPPLSGFWSKLIIIIALWQAGFRVYAVIAIFVSLLTLAYMLRMQRKIFFGKTADRLQDVEEAGMGLVVPEMILATITVAVGVAAPLTPFVLTALTKVLSGIR